MGIALLIIGALIFAGSITLLGIYLHKFCKSLTLGGQVLKIEGNYLYIFIGSIVATSLGFLLVCLGMTVFNNWNFNAGDYTCEILGSLFSGAALSLFIASFVIFFYRKDLEAKQRKIVQIAMICSIPLFIAGMWMWTDAIANFISYPLPNAISFKEGLGYPLKGDYGLTIAFYGVLVVSGAVVTYFIVDHAIYAKYGKHGLIDTLFLVAFPLGLVGARLWYVCVLEPTKYFYDNFWDSFVRVINVTEGGLAIQGGAILGIISGILFALKFRKYMNIRWLVDVCIPGILIAQAIGRWGNFFNQEVFGNATDPNMWWFLPKMIANNMYITAADKINTPLFLIESVINVCGFFIIRYAIGRGLKKHLKQGDQAFMYLLWYGLVRVGLEPLRVGFTLNVQSTAFFGYLQSWITAFVMVAIGILGMVGLRVFEYVRRKQGKEVKEYEAI